MFIWTKPCQAIWPLSLLKHKQCWRSGLLSTRRYGSVALAQLLPGNLLEGSDGVLTFGKQLYLLPAPGIQSEPSCERRTHHRTMSAGSTGLWVLLYSACCSQVLYNRSIVPTSDVFAGPRFSSRSARWPSQHGISRMRRSNLIRVLIAIMRSDKNPSELTSSIVLRRTSFHQQVELYYFPPGNPFRRLRACFPVSSGIACHRSTCGA